MPSPFRLLLFLFLAGCLVFVLITLTLSASTTLDATARTQSQLPQLLVPRTSSLLDDYRPPWASSSLSLAIDAKEEDVRCSRYNWSFDPSRTARRRLFWGGLIANEPQVIFDIMSAEVWDLYHTVAFVESNMTQMKTFRELNYPPNSASLRKLSKKFGPSSIVTVDIYDDPDNPDKYLERENMQRDVILTRWKTNGMTASDVGIVSDPDETFTRDFLMALMTCDVPVFRPNQENCREPKIIANNVQFEGTPDCVSFQTWHHPDAILGECIVGIGDEAKHPVYYENDDGRGRKRRKQEGDSLWDPWGYRMRSGGHQISSKLGPGMPGHYTGYHFHNFFENVEDVRHKYLT